MAKKRATKKPTTKKPSKPSARDSQLASLRETVRRANTLARFFYESHGYRVIEDYRFDKAHHPQERGMWNLASIAYEYIDGTSLDDVLDEIKELESDGNTQEEDTTEEAGTA